MIRGSAILHRFSRRGSILVAVLVVIAISALAGSTAMYYGEAAASGAEVTLRRTRSRAMAWSGVQALMAELDAQRDKLLDGEPPLVTTQWQVFESAGRRGIVRLAALEQDESGLERWVVSENAKLDVNRATSEMLATLGSVGETRAAAIVASRDKGYGSVEELVRIPGVAEVLASENGGAYARVLATDGEESLQSLLTVFSFDPNIQSGIDPGGSDARGKLRINLNVEWSDALADAIRARFGAAAADSAKALFDSGAKFKSISDVAGALKRANLQPSAWAPFLDAFTVNPDPYIPGRVDINRARASVLAAIPGLTKETADEMVRRRQGLEIAARRSVTWPLTEGIVSEADFLKAVDWLTTRSMQWRARVEVGVVGIESDESAKSAKLDERLMVEVVIDVASERPRVAYLRDVSLRETAAVLSEQLPAAEVELKEGESGPGPVDPLPGGSGLEMDARLKMASALDFGKATPESAATPVPPVSAPATPLPAASEPRDRRIGRWTSRMGGSGSTNPAETKP